ncbi:hypothetical protein RHMOL_Rhmol13G0179200 [Rhododendron molle]|uniref:Uncharacterized protein n=1 Tax=Rhododendron molle TaxID=49168 RepID=A0ACC0L917_RHOML|nr:hypothetical protein RHMOL_Rhmol13G0179200 [Rhododendron molle]
MESPLAAMLDPWLARTETIDWASPRSQGLASIRDLRYVGPRPELLEAAMIHWDSVVHVFRNYDNEMCPTMEEFQAYLPGFANSDVLAVPPVQENMSHLLMMKLNIFGELTASIIHDGELDIPRLIELYRPGGILENHVAQAHRRFAFSICALAAYALVPANGRVGPSVPTKQRLQWQSPAAPGWPTRSSPGRLGTFPETDTRTTSAVVGWYMILHDMQCDDFVWRCPWLIMPEMGQMAVNSAGFERVIIAGLASFTFYIPGRILHQLRTSQGLHRAGIEEFQLSDFNVPTLRDYRRLWRNGVLEGPSPDFVDWLDSHYVAWVCAEIRARPGDWISFQTHGLATFRYLRSVRLHPEILWAAVRFWDQNVHVFRFGDDELCPTVEEFKHTSKGSPPV